MDIIDNMKDKKDEKLNTKNDTENLEKKFVECEKKRDEYLAGWQRARADYLNNKKDEAKRAGDLIFFAQSEIILEIISILDNFEKAEQEVQKFVNDDVCNGFENFYNGFLQIKKQMREVLKNYNIEDIKTIGEKFNPNFAEAVEEVVVENKESGIIVEEVKKGYKLKDKIIRPAKVKVAK